jgi:hypothetical protein
MPDYIQLIGTAEDAMYWLTLAKLHAEAKESSEQMQEVANLMHAQLGPSHPYSIRTKSEAALLRPPSGYDQAVRACREAVKTSFTHYKQIYTGTIHARVALARCLIRRQSANDLTEAREYLDDVKLTDIVNRFGENTTETWSGASSLFCSHL